MFPSEDSQSLQSLLLFQYSHLLQEHWCIPPDEKVPSVRRNNNVIHVVQHYFWKKIVHLWYTEVPNLCWFELLLRNAKIEFWKLYIHIKSYRMISSKNTSTFSKLTLISHTFHDTHFWTLILVSFCFSNLDVQCAIYSSFLELVERSYQLHHLIDLFLVHLHQ